MIDLAGGLSLSKREVVRADNNRAG